MIVAAVVGCAYHPDDFSRPSVLEETEEHPATRQRHRSRRGAVPNVVRR